MQTLLFDLEQQPEDTALALGEIAALLDSQTAPGSNVIACVGAGISTAAGIRDFRSPEGLYTSRRDNNANSNATASGSTSTHPATATTSPTGRLILSNRQLFSSGVYHRPAERSAHLQFLASFHQQVINVSSPATPTHKFLDSLSRRGKLRRIYTQNIDGLEKSKDLHYLDFREVGKRMAEEEEGRVVSGADVIQLHGSVREVRCTHCAWTGKWRKRHTEAFQVGESVDCPACLKSYKERKAAGKRALPPTSYLRPSILLYEETLLSSHTDVLQSLITADLESSPTLLLVMGTSLLIPGFKSLVKDYIKEVRANGGISVLINLEPVGRAWEEEFDYHLVGKCEEVTVEILRLWKAMRRGRRGERRKRKEEEKRIGEALTLSEGERSESERKEEKVARKAARKVRRAEKRRKVDLSTNGTNPNPPLTTLELVEMETAPQEEDEDPDASPLSDQTPLSISAPGPTVSPQVTTIRPEENLSEILSSIPTLHSSNLSLPETTLYPAEFISRLINLLPPTFLTASASVEASIQPDDSPLNSKRKHSTLSPSSSSTSIPLLPMTAKRQRLFPPHYLSTCNPSTSTLPSLSSPSSPSLQDVTSYPYPPSTDFLSDHTPRVIKKFSSLNKLQFELGKYHLAAFVARDQHAQWICDGVPWWENSMLELENERRLIMINLDVGAEVEGDANGDGEAKEKQEEEEEDEEELERRELDREDELARIRLIDYRNYKKRVSEVQAEVDVRVEKEKKSRETRKEEKRLKIEREKVRPAEEEKESESHGKE